MSIQDIATSAQLTDDEYLPIWTALMETARGRSFLREFARRTRASETRTLLDAVQKLEHALLAERQGAAATPDADDETRRLQAAITLAVPALEYAARIGVRARADLQAAVDDIQAASNALRPLIDSGMDDDDAARARRACDSIDARVLDMDEIIAVQQLGDEQAVNATAALAELVTAAPQDNAATPDAPAMRRQPAPGSAHAHPHAIGSQARATPAGGLPTTTAAPKPAAPKSTGLKSTAPAPRPVRHEAPAGHDQEAHHQEAHPAVQKLIQEITARLLNGEDMRPAAPGQARRQDRIRG